MDGNKADADHRGDISWRRLPAPVAGAAAAVGAVSLGLVLIGACGLGGQDTYVAPPPLNADLQAAPVVSQSGTTTPGIVIPPSPTWRVAVDQGPRHTPIPTLTTTSKDQDPDPDPEAPTTASRTTPLHPSTTTRPTTTRPRPTTDPPTLTTEPARPTTPPVTTEPAIAVPTTGADDEPASG
ncbi:hypothetical protein OHB26_17855 [Nocardia sp. NBC_01503]|uniref:hypothetical protein n=1 Tax=Nocardia sp. NBC_01503 TaxID=2975997 RepID=UPI002E7C1127|nr:hypothetical protein [Nocardia sp. NBC_01503]WTL35900.1 hypothetical protein OHB26_17855 [Nocardia sp. NBC_01503]